MLPTGLISTTLLQKKTLNSICVLHVAICERIHRIPLLAPLPVESKSLVWRRQMKEGKNNNPQRWRVSDLAASFQADGGEERKEKRGASGGDVYDFDGAVCCANVSGTGRAAEWIPSDWAPTVPCVVCPRLCIHPLPCRGQRSRVLDVHWKFSLAVSFGPPDVLHVFNTCDVLWNYSPIFHITLEWHTHTQLCVQINRILSITEH